MVQRIVRRARGKARHTLHARRRFEPLALILTYHQICERDVDPWNNAVTPANFREQLAVLEQIASPVDINEIAQAAERGSFAHLPRRAVAITFDDGYANNLRHAAPALVEAKMPGTVFVTTGMVDHPREFWNDELERIFLNPGTLPDVLDVEVVNTRYLWELGADAEYTAEQAHDHRNWLAWHTAPTSRHHLFQELYDAFQPMDAHPRADLLRHLLQWANIPETPRTDLDMLTVSGLREIAAMPGMSIQAHTVTHPVLAQLDEHAQRRELVESRDQLREWLGPGAPVDGMAYPYGLSEHYSNTTADLAREVGYRWAAANIADVMRPTTGVFDLRRASVTNLNGDAFKRWLGWWFGL